MANTHFSGPVISTAGFTGDLTGLALQGGSATAITTSGAIPITTLFSIVGRDGTAEVALTLANGAAGQMKIIKRNDGTKAVVVTPANFKNGTTLTFDGNQETAVLVSDGSSWHSVYVTATVA
jgi:hypothetical protein